MSSWLPIFSCNSFSKCSKILKTTFKLHPPVIRCVLDLVEFRVALHCFVRGQLLYMPCRRSFPLPFGKSLLIPTSCSINTVSYNNTWNSWLASYNIGGLLTKFHQASVIHIWGPYFAEYGSYIPYVRVQVCAIVHASRNYLELPESLQGSSSGRHSNAFETSPSLPSLSSRTQMKLLQYVIRSYATTLSDL